MICHDTTIQNSVWDMPISKSKCPPQTTISYGDVLSLPVSFTGFETFTEVNMHTVALWVMTSCNLVAYQRLGATYCLNPPLLPAVKTGDVNSTERLALDGALTLTTKIRINFCSQKVVLRPVVPQSATAAASAQASLCQWQTKVNKNTTKFLRITQD